MGKKYKARNKKKKKTAQQEKNIKEAQSPHPNTQNWGQSLSLNVLLMMSEGTILPQAVKSI